jgi:hypothetical protein
MSLTLKNQFSEAAKNTQHKDTKRTKIKNNDYLNLSLCPPGGSAFGTILCGFFMFAERRIPAKWQLAST